MTREQARYRNWLKFRLLGWVGHVEPIPQAFTKEEAFKLKEIQRLRNELLQDWDINVEKLTGRKPRKRKWQ